MKKSVFITFTHTPKVMQKLKESFELTHIEKYTREKMLELCQEKNPAGLLVAHGQTFDRKLIQELPESIKIIATSSVGFDHIDLQAAKEKKIIITNTPDVLSNATADMAMALLLCLTRRLYDYQKIMHEGWGKKFSQNEMLGISLEGKTLGIFGMGSIGRMMAKKARAFGMKIIYHNRKRLEKSLEEDALYYDDFKKLLKDSDVLSLHAPATLETIKIMNKESFSLMKEGSILINTARGSLVDEEALLEALASKKLYGAGLDVFLDEPNFNQRFLDFSNVVLAPHMGSATLETRDEMGFLAIKNILMVLEKKAPLTQVCS